MPKEQETQDQQEHEEQTSLSRDDVQRMINGAFRTYSQRNDLNGLVQNAVAEALKGFAPPAPPEKKGEDVPDEVKSLRAQVNELRAKNEAAERHQKEILSRQQRDEERASIERELRSLGVPDRKLPIATAWLHGERRVVVRDDEGRIGMKLRRGGNGPDGYDEVVGLAEGLGEWVKSDEGKEFLPPRSVAGSGGARGGTPPVRNGRAVDPKDAARAAFAELLHLPPGDE